VEIFCCDYPAYSQIDPYSGAQDDDRSSKKDVLDGIFAHGKSGQNVVHGAFHDPDSPLTQAFQGFKNTIVALWNNCSPEKIDSQLIS
jgi:hypothetical protein